MTRIATFVSRMVELGASDLHLTAGKPASYRVDGELQRDDENGALTDEVLEQLLFEIAPLDEYRVVLEVDESEIDEIQVGQSGAVVFYAFPGESFDIEAANQAFYEWKKHKKKGIMSFRDHGYVSPMTGTKAPPHHTAWVDALDDSLESYLQI